MYDYLIVGHGLAGALLSQELIKRGKRLIVVDSNNKNAASKVAAGIYNPITGRKMRKTWMADQFFPMLSSYYTELEQVLNTRFFYDIGIYRPFFSIEQQNDWNANMEKYEHFVSEVSSKRHSSGRFYDEFGGIYLKNAGYVDVKKLLESHENFLTDKGSYREALFHKDQLKVENGRVSYGGMGFDKVVFCSGAKQELLPHFDWLPFKPVKGEIFDFRLDIEIETIVNRGVFILPRGNGVYRVGATYDWKNLNEETTELGKFELLEKMNLLFNGKAELIGGIAGIRPATKDRRPFIGVHPQFEQLYIFNGFGSKGVSMIPYFSKKFADCLESNETIEKEVNISRYFSLNYDAQKFS